MGARRDPAGRGPRPPGLLDELRLWFHPLMLGCGDPGDLLFRDGLAAQFELAEVTRLASGTVILSYSA